MTMLVARHQPQAARSKHVDKNLAATVASVTDLVNHRQPVNEDLKQLDENIKSFDLVISFPHNLVEQVDILKFATVDYSQSHNLNQRT